MRIIAGQWRSRRLLQPKTDETRPMPDRVKEAIFSKLGSIYDTPGALPDLHVADVFAGSGSLGLEALSRGAASCVFFESKPLALEALRGNLLSLGVVDSGSIVMRSAWISLPQEHRLTPFGLIFLDPPYRDSRDWTTGGTVPKLLSELSSKSDAKPVVVWHHEAKADVAPPTFDPWQVLDHRIYGTNAITFLQP